MSDRKGFSLIEIIVVMVIIGVLAIIAIPNYITMIESGMAQAAKNNLMLIYQAQYNYYFRHGSYCVKTCPNNYPTCVDGCANSLYYIDQNLNLKIEDNNYTYVCTIGDINTGAQYLGCEALRANSVGFPQMTIFGMSPGGVGALTPVASQFMCQVCPLFPPTCPTAYMATAVCPS